MCDKRCEGVPRETHETTHASRWHKLKHMTMIARRGMDAMIATIYSSASEQDQVKSATNSQIEVPPCDHVSKQQVQAAQEERTET